MKKLSVGIFDSGVGGLTVLDACRKKLPFVRFVYFGDNGNAPYGGRDAEEIFALSCACCRKLLACGVDVIVVGCNTATSACVGRLREAFAVPVIGTEPAVKSAAQRSKNVLVLATPATVRGARLRTLIERFPDCKFTLFPCETLARSIEREELSRIDLSFLPQGDFDGVVLGCTHYVLIKERIRQRYGVPVYDGNEGVASRLEEVVGTLASKRTVGKDGAKGCLFSVKNREEFPPAGKTNKCLDFLPENGGKKRAKGVKFIGKHKKINRKMYKQMFASANLSQNCAVHSQKIVKILKKIALWWKKMEKSN